MTATDAIQRVSAGRRTVAAVIACCVLWVDLLEPTCAAEKTADVASKLTAEQEVDLRSRLKLLDEQVAELEKSGAPYRPWADVAMCSKGVAWALRHRAFPKADSFKQALSSLEMGIQRAALLKAGKSPWEGQAGRTVRGYRSSIDDSIQPYAVTLPPDFGRNPQKRWPLQVVLHGRDDSLSEIKFLHQHEGKPAENGADWIQLDVYGRCCNAYRWAGETDVFESLKDVQARYRIDERRIVLHGFSMGGAGAWHLGLHHPSRWCSVGPGAGFIDFYQYQKVTTPLPAVQHSTLHIYDSADYVQNAFDVPICTYGGELDKQLVASTQMKAAADKLKVPMSLIIGPGVGHQFHPDSRRQFMAFHHEKQQAGRVAQLANRKIRFVTWTVKYNNCDWVTVEEQLLPYHETLVQARVDDEGHIAKIATRNVGVLRLSRDLADVVEIDGVQLPLADAADRLLPEVYYESSGTGWSVLSYNASLGFPQNRDGRKRKNLQGPIDDAFMQPFVCVMGSGTPWSKTHHEWAKWTQQRFSDEFDRWFHGQVQVVADKDVTPELIQSKNLILFGDPGSNSFLAKVSRQLPFKWERESLQVSGKSYDPETHGVACILPNPLNPRRYIVVNSGHTFHATDLRNSNAWLFPRLGDIAVLKRTKQADGTFAESSEWAAIFDSSWRLPVNKMSDSKTSAQKSSK